MVIIDDLKKYLEKNKLNYDQIRNNIPADLVIPKENMFMFSRLQTLQLIDIIRSDEVWRSIEYSWSTSSQGFHSSIEYNFEIEIRLTDFGKSFMKWIKNK